MSNSLEALSGGTDFSDLDELLSDAMEAKRKAKAIPRPPRSNSNPKPQAKHFTPAEVADMAKRAAEWQTPREWKAVADCAMFSVQHCSHCGYAHHQFLGQYQQQYAKQSNIDRWIKSDPVANAGLPKVIKTTDEYVSMCSECSHEHGWTFSE